MCSVYIVLLCVFFFFKQKTAYEMRISDWSSDVCSSDLVEAGIAAHLAVGGHVDHHHAQRPVAAGLQGEHAVVLDEAGEAAAERQHLGEQARHRRRIVVAGQAVVADALQPPPPAADSGGPHEQGLPLVTLPIGRATCMAREW